MGRCNRNCVRVVIILVSLHFGLEVGKVAGNFSPTDTWSESWLGVLLHEENLTRNYTNGDIAFYVDPEVSVLPNQTFFESISETWKKAKVLCKSVPIGTDLKLYLILHQDKHVEIMHSAIYDGYTHDWLNVIECGQNNENPCDLEKYITNLVDIVTKLMTQKAVLPSEFATKWGINEIITLNAYIQLGYPNLGQTMLETTIEKSTNFPRQNTKLFREWYLPIYDQNKGNQVIQKFLSVMQPHVGMGKLNESSGVLPGEFVHFWSEAVGNDLRPLAYGAFDWTTEYENQFWAARKAFTSSRSYNDSEIFISSIPKWNKHWLEHVQNMQQFDYEQVTFYCTTPASDFGWLFASVSEAWKWVRHEDNNTLFGDNPHLYVIINNKSEHRAHFAIHTDKIQEYRNLAWYGSDSQKTRDKRQASVKSRLREILHVVKTVVIESTEWPADLLSASEWKFPELIEYHIVNETGGEENALKYINRKLNESTDFPQRGVQLLPNWYLPLYKRRGNGVINKFLRLISLRKNCLTLKSTNATITPGEFVHFWSEAANHDLRDLAFRAFGWVPEYERQFQIVRGKCRSLSYAESFPNASDPLYQPPVTWKGQWNIHSEYLARNYSNSHIAIYTDLSVQINSYWILESLSKAWDYAKSSYGQLGPDPILYVTLRSGSSINCSSSFTSLRYDAVNDNRRLIDCEVKTSISNTSLEIFLPLVGTIVETALNETGRLATNPQGGWKMADILTYDIYVNGLKKTEDARSWVARFESTESSSYKDSYWFKKWLLPIYTDCGGAKALNRSFSLTKSYKPHDVNEEQNEKQMDVGEFVHFWSGAARMDLEYLAYTVFNWTKETQIKFVIAKKKFQQFQYPDLPPTFPWLAPPEQWKEHWTDEKGNPHNEELTLDYLEKYVAFYVDSETKSPITTESIRVVSDAWTYANKTYGPFGPDPYLYVVLHSRKRKGCHMSKESSYWDPKFEQKLVIDCGLGFATQENSSPCLSKSVDLITEGIGVLVQRAAKRTGAWPARSFAGWKMSDILVYDIYNGIGRTDYANEWKDCKVEEVDSIQNRERKLDGAHWFRDWFYHIYDKYGKTTVLVKFLSLLNGYWHKNGSDYQGQMNAGEYILFWSEAAGFEFFDEATVSLGLDSRSARAQLRAAILDYTFDYSGKNNRDTEIVNGPDNSDMVTWILISVGVVVILLLLALFALHRRKLGKLREQITKLTPTDVSEFYQGAAKIREIAGNASIQSAPYKQELEIQRSQLDIDYEQVLGSGEYGLVLKGRMKTNGLPGRKPTYTTVAIKTTKPNVDVQTFKALLAELKVMGHLGKYENIAELVGAVTVNIRDLELFVVMELCENGDLLGYMKKKRKAFKDLLFRKNTKETDTVGAKKESSTRFLNSTTFDHNTMQQEFSSFNLLEWSHQISSAMAYIGSKNVIHGDLAARNILLTSNNVAKISDFGLSRQLVNYSNYLKTSETPVPWRWMALESLCDMNFSVESDVWAFGVTLYEIFSLGSIPYPGSNWTHEFVEQLSSGYRLGMPEFGNDFIHKIMLNCMEKEPEDRIGFTAITETLHKAIIQHFPKAGISRCTYITVDDD